MRAAEITEDGPFIHQTSVIDSNVVEAPARSSAPTVRRLAWRARYVIGLVTLDFLIGLGAAVTALTLRFGVGSDGPNKQAYILVTCLLPFAWVVSLAANRAYELRRLFVGNDEYERVLRSGLGLTAALAIAAFSFDYRLARGYLIIAVPLATSAAICGRYVVRQRLHRQWGRGERLTRVILVGHEQAVLETTRRLSRERYHGLGVVGACLPATPNGAPGYHRATPGLPPVYGNFEKVAEAVSRAGADTVIVLSCPEIDGAAVRRLAWRLERDEIDLIVASSLIDVAGDRTTIRPVDGLPLLHVEHPRLKGARRAVKEIFDQVSALLLLILAAPVLFAIALCIRFAPGAGGPAIFMQERVGKGGKPFMIYKFRTMYVDAEARLADLRHLNDNDGTLFKMKADPRVTPVGKILRRLSLDELPQLLNVLKGDMSLVGPRPPLQREVAQYPEDMRRRLVVKPGLTGLWQVSGRSDLSWEESIRLDLSYVENWTLSMDLAILARTLIAVLRRSGAY
jgi:exopolysaccharide biosynthesis polyprenyl glycosylphosphotransferase